jgi:hypothetical protein
MSSRVPNRLSVRMVKKMRVHLAQLGFVFVQQVIHCASRSTGYDFTGIGTNMLDSGVGHRG